MLENEMKVKNTIKVGLIILLLACLIGFLFLLYASSTASKKEDPKVETGGSTTEDNPKDEIEKGTDTLNLSNLQKEKMTFLLIALMNTEPDFYQKNFKNMDSLSIASKVMIPYLYMQSYQAEPLGSFQTLYEGCKAYNITAIDIEKLASGLLQTEQFAHQAIGEYYGNYLGDPTPYQITYQDGTYQITGGPYCTTPNKVLPGGGYFIYENNIYTENDIAKNYVKFAYRSLVASDASGLKYAYQYSKNEKVLFYLTKPFDQSEEAFEALEKKQLRASVDAMHQVRFNYQVSTNGAIKLMSTDVLK